MTIGTHKLGLVMKHRKKNIFSFQDLWLLLKVTSLALRVPCII